MGTSTERITLQDYYKIFRSGKFSQVNRFKWDGATNQDCEG
jgi:hypothetical protein